MTNFLRHRLWPAIALLIALTLVTGVIYPVVVTAVAQVAFPSQANGSFVTTADGRTIGSSLIGQAFSKPQYFWGRPSAAGVTDENPAGWEVVDGALERTFEFPSFPEAIEFVNRVAAAAEEADHHPDIEIHYRQVKLRWWTHSAQAITDRDRELAERSGSLAG